MDYFSPAVQIGLTATPKRVDNVDTYNYFGDPVYIYSLKEGINDGFLTPFKVKRIKTSIDDYVYTDEDEVIEGEVEKGRIYTEAEHNRIIEIKARENKRVKIFMNDACENDKTIIFCALQKHASLVRDLVNQNKKTKDINYCVRVTSDDGEIGEQFLREFQDNEKTIPTILTTSTKLSTGVDTRNIRNIILMRPVNSIIEFKQIIGRGTRLFEGKYFFTIYDFVDAYQNFFDKEWDGEPIGGDICDICNQAPCICEKEPPKSCKKCGKIPCVCIKEPAKICENCNQNPCICIKKVKIKLKDGKEREIQYFMTTSFWDVDGTPISEEEFLNNLFGELPKLFKNENELRKLWSKPTTRKILLNKLDEAGFDKDSLKTLQKLIDAQKSDLFDVLRYVFNSDNIAISRKDRVDKAKNKTYISLDENQKSFIEFVLSKYIQEGEGELEQDKLSTLLKNKYQSLEDAKSALGDISKIKELFVKCQELLYEDVA